MSRSASRPVLNPDLLVLAVLGALTRLWNLFTPNAVVFDELHFEHHAGHYLDGTYYFDVHPPLGKLLYAAEARLFGVSAGTLLAGEPAVMLRLLPALLGALVVPLIYVLLRQLGASRAVATLGGFVVLCDNALIVDSRLILLEPLLIAFGVIALVLFLAGRRRSGAPRLALLSLAALSAGCAISVKWTGASALGVMLLVWAADARSEKRAVRTIAVEGVLLLFIPVMVYVSAFAVHFAELPRAGVDDGMMSPAIRRSLVGDPMYDARAHVSLVAKLADVHRAIGAGNRSLEGVAHPAASAWYTWPIMKHPIGLWQDATPRTRSVVLVGNPVVWWGGGVGALVAVVLLFRRSRRTPSARRWTFALSFVAGCYLIDYLPFIAITRVMYIYHYLFAELWLSVFAVLSIGIVAGWQSVDDDAPWTFSSARSAALYWGVAVAVLVGLAYFAPLTYGWTLSPEAYDARFWVLHPHL